jgi:hypothetical protein
MVFCHDKLSQIILYKLRHNRTLHVDNLECVAEKIEMHGSAVVGSSGLAKPNTR